MTIMLWSCVVLAVLSSTVRCEDSGVTLNRQKRQAFAFAGFPWNYAGGGAFAGFPYFGFPQAAPPPPAVVDYPRRSYFPFWPTFPVIEFPTPWYEGPNVCKEEKKSTGPKPDDDFQAWLNEDSPNGASFSSDYSSEHENCWGSNTKYTCTKRTSDSSGQSLVATRYKCCYGFVRNPNGPGCVESADQNKPKVAPIANEQIYYGIAPDSRTNSKSSSASAGNNLH